MIHQQTIIDERTYHWTVDQVAATTVGDWIARNPGIFAADLSGMAEYFPHWLLSGAANGVPGVCQRCAGPGVPACGAIRCVVCSNPVAADGLIWTGHLPVLARPEKSFVKRQAALERAGFAQVEAGGSVYLLVPLAVLYPQEWPNVEPVVRYSGRWLDAAGLPRASAAHHLIERGRACIFAWGQWQAMAIHEVLQQRMVNHATSLFKVMAGLSPTQAFIGRIHHDDWQPEPA